MRNRVVPYYMGADLTLFFRQESQDNQSYRAATADRVKLITCAVITDLTVSLVDISNEF
jgi:hypothetical protein